MATRTHTIFAPGVHVDAATLMLVRLFPRWRGDASEPALPPPRPNRPAPSAANQLVEA